MKIDQFEWTAAEGEFKNDYLKPIGFKNIQRPDWIAEYNGIWYSFEIKCKEPFQPSPFDGSDKILPNGGHGLNRYQLLSRLQLEESTGIKAVLAVKDPVLGWIGAPMNELIAGPHYITRNNIVIFPVESFKPLKPAL